MHANLAARTDSFPFADPAFCRRVWAALRKNWPRPLAACLMGNHLHLLVAGDPDDERRRLATVLGQMHGPRFRCVGSASEGRLKLRRDVRYVVLNPCRAQLAKDPLEWLWSTHRDLVGATLEDWVDREAVLALERGWDPLESAHRYISGDPYVAVESTPLPLPAEPAAVSRWPLQALINAATAAGRGHPVTERGASRTMLFQLARDHGWTGASNLARLTRCERSAVYRAWKAEDIAAPARLCLGDARLRTMRQPSEPRHKVWRNSRP